MPPECGPAAVFSVDCTKSDGLPGFFVPLLPKPQAQETDLQGRMEADGQGRLLD